MGHHEYGQQESTRNKKPDTILCQFTAGLQAEGKALFHQGGRAQEAADSILSHTLLLAGNSNE